MKKTAIKPFLPFLFVISLIGFAAKTYSQNTILNNDLLRFGNGIENSLNPTGNLNQPFYFNSDNNLWRKLTYSNYALDNAFATGGDGTQEWNLNGIILPNPTLVNQSINKNNFIEEGLNRGYGTIISSGTINLDGKTFLVENIYKLPEDKAYIEVTVRLTNLSQVTAINVRTWIGTRDDWVGMTDGPREQKGNIIDGEFVQINNPAERAAAIKISSGDEAVLFYTVSDRGNTIIQRCCSWGNVINQNPQTSAIDETTDGSYGFFVRMDDLAPGESDDFTWYYAAGTLADIDDIINEVARVSGAVSNITYTSADFKAKATSDATGYWMVVERDAATPDAQQVKAGQDYSSVTVVANGSGTMSANIERTFNLTGLSAGTDYDLYFVSENDVPLFSDILKVQFSTRAYTVPSVTTTSVSDITKVSAVTGGVITDDGGQTVTARGICWSTTPNPDLNNSFTLDDSGTGSFSSSINGLLPNTTYYVKAYSTNSVGTAYGEQESFTTLPNNPPVVQDDGPFTVNTGESLTGNLLSNDSDADGDDLYITEQPSLPYGQFTSFDLETGEFEYLAPTDQAGTFTFNYTVTDGIASVQGTVTINVIDNIAPEVITRNVEIHLDASGSAGISTDDIDNGSADNIEITELNLDRSTFDCGDLGNITVTLTARDAAGNTAEATAVVTVIDAIDPEIIANEIYQYETDPAACGAIADLRFYTADNCVTNGNLAFNGNARGGLEGWNVTMNGGNGWKATNGWFITSYSTAVKHQVIDLLAHGYDAATLDAAPVITVSEDYVGIAPKNYQDIYFINIELRDAGGNKIDDFSSGDLICSNNIQTVTHSFSGYGEGVRYVFVEHGGKDVEFWAGHYGSKMGNLQVLVDAPDITPNHPVQQISGIKLANEFPVGTTVNSYKVMDVAGNTAIAEFRIVVQDNAPPVAITKPLTLQLNAEGIASATAEMVNDNSFDNCEIASMQISQTEFSCSDIGLNTVVFTITDINGNESTADADIVVEDNILPEVITRDVTVLLDENGTASINVSDVDNGSTDACGIESMSLSKTIFNCEDAGINEVALTVTDVNGNTATAKATVFVEDRILPEVSTRDITVLLDENGTASIVPADIDDNSSDACGIESLSLSKTSFSCEDLGDNEVVLTVTDNNGNSNTATAIVTVIDNEAPVIDFRPLTVYLSKDGIYKLNRNNIEAITKAGEEEGGTTDNCTPYNQLKIEISQTLFTCEHAATHVPVTITVTDASGNSSTSETTIWVIDPYAPKELCRDTTIYLDKNGNALLSAADLDAGTTDACGIKEIWLDNYNFDCSNTGENTVTLYAKDIHNNWSSCVSTVTVVDTIAPIANPVPDIQIEVAGGITETRIDYPEIEADDNCGVHIELTDGIGPYGLFPIGTTTETWQVSDFAGNTSTISFNVIVTSLNSAPVVAKPIADQWLVATQTLKLPLVWNEIFMDADGDELECEVLTEDEGDILSWAKLTHDTLSFMPVAGDSGCIRIILRASDASGASAVHKFNVCIEKDAVNTETVYSSSLDVQVYPNPAHNKVNISFKPAGSYSVELKMTDVNGRLVMHKIYQPGENIIIDVSDKVSGLYLINLKIDDKYFLKKLMIR